MPTSDIFISYSRSDRAAAKHLAACLEAEGFAVWWDAALHAGEKFDEVIEAQLRSAKAVVVLWSKRSVASRWVRAEATLADRMNKLAPVLIEECERPIIFELIHTTDLTDWSGEEDDPVWLGFVDDLRRLSARDREQAAEEKGPVVPAFLRPRPQRQEEVPAAAVAVLDKPRPSTPSTPHVHTETARFAKIDPIAADFHCLELTVGERVQQRFVVSPTGLRIGRTPPADVILPDPSISRAHCLVQLADDRLRVTDLRSTNGTFIDGKRIEGTAYLEVGSVLRIGNMALRHATTGAAEA